jgi:hypothetical protein
MADPQKPTIAYCKISPGLGIARVGDSPDEFFIGAESPGRDSAPHGGYKDKLGRVKRQAARFRIYAYDKDDRVIQEITADDAEIRWTAHLANRKMEHHFFIGRYWVDQYPAFARIDPTTPPLRNQQVMGEDRARLVIDPGPRTISGIRAPAKAFDTGVIGSLPYTEITADNKECVAGHRSGYMGVPFTQPANPTAIPAPPPPPPTPLPPATSGNGTACQAWARGQVLAPVKQSEPRTVYLGELRTDGHGRLLVLGGRGESGSVIPHNEIGYLNTDSYFANNDYWYDDTSDGWISAEVTLKDGTPLKVVDRAWVLVTPPKFAPSARMFTTLYETAMETAELWPGQAGAAGKPPLGGAAVPGPAGAAARPVSFIRDVYPILDRLDKMTWVNATAYQGHGAGAASSFVARPMLKLLSDPGENGRQAREHLFSHLRNPNLDRRSKEANDQANFSFMPLFGGDGGAPVVAGSPASKIYGPDGELLEIPGGVASSWLALSKPQYRVMERWRDGDFIADWTPAWRPAEPPRIDDYPLEDRPAMLDKAALDPCVGRPFFPGIEMTYISELPDTWSAPCRINQSWRPGDVTRWMAVPWQSDFSQCRRHWWAAQRPDGVVTEAAFQAALEAYQEEFDGPLAQVLADRAEWSRGLPQDPPQINNGMVRAWKEFGFVVETVVHDQKVYVETQRSPFFGVEANIRDYFYYLMNIDAHVDFLPKARELVHAFLAEAWRKQDLAGQTDEHWRFFPYSREALDDRLDEIYNGFVLENDALHNSFVLESDSAAQRAGALPTTREAAIYGLLQMAPFNQLDGAWLRNATPPGPISELGAMLFQIYMDELGDALPERQHCNVYTDLLKSVGIYLPDLNTRAYADDPRFLDSAFTVPVFILAISQFSQEFFPEILGMTLYLEWSSIGLVPKVDQLKAFGIDPHFFVLHVGIDNTASGHGAIAKRAVQLYLDQLQQAEGQAAVQAAWQRIWNGYVAFGVLGSLGDDIASHQAKPATLHDRMVAMITAKAPYASLNHRTKQLGPNRINDWFLDPEGFMSELVKAGIVVPGKPEISPIFQLTGFNGPMFHVFTPDELQLWHDWIVSLGDATVPPVPPIRRAMELLIDKFRERQQGVQAHRVLLKGPDPRQPNASPAVYVTHPIRWWFDLATFDPVTGREVPDTAALMRALAHEENGWITRGAYLQSPLVTDILAGNGDMAVAFREVAPDSGGKTYWNILVDWIEAYCPVDEETPAAAQLRKAREAARRAKRPKKRIWGMGSIH